MNSRFKVGQTLEVYLDHGILRLKVVNIYDGILCLNPINTWELYDIEESEFLEFLSETYGNYDYYPYIN